MKYLRHLIFRKTSQVFIDLVIFLFAWLSAYVIRFEGPPPQSYMTQMIILALFVALSRALSFHAASVYRIVWRYISIRDTFVILKAIAPLTVALIGLRYMSPDELSMLRVPLSVIIIEFLLALLGTLGVRMLRRLSAEGMDRDELSGKNGSAPKNVLLVGAGNAGSMILKELQQRVDLGIRVAGFLAAQPKSPISPASMRSVR
jgi:FlaA1/EpsC-like NDP-sugar epimerase